MEFEIRYYQNSLGKLPIHDFLLELASTDKDLFTQTTKGIEKLRNSGYHKEPLSKYLEPGLWELRIKVENRILRIIYTFTKGQIIILLHGFVKKQQKTPIKELELARKRLAELKERELL